MLHTEDLGSDNYIFVDIGSDEPVIVRQGGKSSITLDSTVSLRPQEGRLYKFDGSGRPMA